MNNALKMKFLLLLIFVSIIFALWITPVSFKLDERSGLIKTYNTKQGLFLTIGTDRTFWNTNLLRWGWSIFTSIAVGGMNGPVVKSNHNVYKLEYSDTKLVLKAPGSVGEMFLYQKRLYFINAVYPNEIGVGIVGEPRLYLWKNNEFTLMPNNLTYDKWIKKADHVISGELVKANRAGEAELSICGKKAIIRESRYMDIVTLTRDQNKQQILFKSKPDSRKIGW